MKALTDNIELFAPPRWLMFALAAALGAALMVAFVNTMEDNIRRGEELRQAQRVGGVRQALVTGTDAVAQIQQRQLQQGNAPALQRTALLQESTKVARYDY